MKIGIGLTIPEISNLPGQSGGGAIPDPLVLSYSSNAFCANASDPTPTVTGNVGAGTFSSTSGLVFVSTSTGVIDISASTPSATPYVITYTDTNAATATFNLTLNALDDAGFSYSANSFAQNFPDPTPTITGLADGTFSGTTGLVIDSSTGVIDLDASTIASHTITYDTTSSPSKVCPNTSTQTVNVLAALLQLDNAYSMSFDGASDFINISNPTELTGDFTISAWVFPTRVDDSYEMIYTQGTAISALLNPPYFAVRDTKLHVYIQGVYETNLGFINANEWQHVAVTRTSGVVNLYRNGVEYNGTRPTLNGTINNNSDGIIGKWFNSSHYFKGKIDELSVFNVGLTELEVKKIYYATEDVSGVSKTADLNDLTTPPVKWYRMGD